MNAVLEDIRVIHTLTVLISRALTYVDAKLDILAMDITVKVLNQLFVCSEFITVVYLKSISTIYSFQKNFSNVIII